MMELQQFAKIVTHLVKDAYIIKAIVVHAIKDLHYLMEHAYLLIAVVIKYHIMLIQRLFALIVLLDA